MSDILAEHRKVWNKKPLLREIYSDWYKMLAKDLTQGKTVELGSGTANFKEFLPEAVTSDIDPHPWLDMVFDAHKMPFATGSVANLVMIDVFHHLADPIRFLQDGARVLKKGGRLLMIEPYPSPVSLIVYKLFHPEQFNFRMDYFNLKLNNEKKPWDSNQAIPYLVFFNNFNKFNNKFRKIYKVTRKEKFSFLTYPLSGGFENRQLYPTALKPGFDVMEKLIAPLKDILAFRCYIVLTKT